MEASHNNSSSADPSSSKGEDTSKATTANLLQRHQQMLENAALQQLSFEQLQRQIQLQLLLQQQQLLQPPTFQQLQAASLLRQSDTASDLSSSPLSSLMGSARGRPSFSTSANFDMGSLNPSQPFLSLGDSQRAGLSPPSSSFDRTAQPPTSLPSFSSMDLRSSSFSAPSSQRPPPPGLPPWLQTSAIDSPLTSALRQPQPTTATSTTNEMTNVLSGVMRIAELHQQMIHASRGQTAGLSSGSSFDPTDPLALAAREHRELEELRQRVQILKRQCDVLGSYLQSLRPLYGSIRQSINEHPEILMDAQFPTVILQQLRTILMEQIEFTRECNAAAEGIGAVASQLSSSLPSPLDSTPLPSLAHPHSLSQHPSLPSLRTAEFKSALRGSTTTTPATTSSSSLPSLSAPASSSSFLNALPFASPNPFTSPHSSPATTAALLSRPILPSPSSPSFPMEQLMALRQAGFLGGPTSLSSLIQHFGSSSASLSTPTTTTTTSSSLSSPQGEHRGTKRPSSPR